MLVTNDTKIAIELAKIQHDNKAAYAVEDGCLVAKPAYFEDCNIFSRDLILNTRPGIPQKSKLLDEEFNKGIYIDISDMGNFGHRYVRLPSASILNQMTKNLPSGELVYPRLADLMSRVLQVCMERTRGNMQLIGNQKKYQETGRVGGLLARYFNEIRQLLNTRENFLKSLIQPVCTGIAPKQMVDKYIPEGVAVILNDTVYNSLKHETYGKDYDQYDSFYCLGLRNPVLWQAMVQRLEIWSKHQWADHLHEVYGIDIDDYICVDHCQHLIIMNIVDMLQPMADADGDLYPLMVVPGEAAQAEMDTLFETREIDIRVNDHYIKATVRVLPTVHYEELGWIYGKFDADGSHRDGYTQGEIGSDAKLFDHTNGVYHDLPEYKLNTTVLSSQQVGDALPYNKLLSNAVIAKNKVATGTLQLWHINSGTELFRSQYQKDIEAAGGYKSALRRRDTLQGLQMNNGVQEAFTDADWPLMSHMYSRIVQDFIVRGIKHNTSGSSGADIFLLENTTAEGSANTMKEAKLAMQSLGYSREQVNKLMFMIKWLKAEGYLDALALYVSFYNRGNIPSDKEKAEFGEQFKNIEELTINGRIMSPYSDIVKQISDFNGRVVSVKNTNNSNTGMVTHGSTMVFATQGAMKVA